MKSAKALLVVVIVLLVGAFTVIGWSQAPGTGAPPASTSNVEPPPATPAAPATTQAASPPPTPKAIVGDIFATCCMPCHQGKTPAAKLDLSKDRFEAALVNVASAEIDTLKLVDTAKPQKSYLLMKLRADKRIRANPMPLRAPALDVAKIKAVELWIAEVVKAAAAAMNVPSLGVPVAPPSEATVPAPQPPTTDARKAPDSGGTTKG